MYSSLYGSQGHSKHRAKSKLSAGSEAVSLTALDVNMRPLLDHNARLLNGRLTVSYGPLIL
jgi:hypothetical protein